MEIRPASSEEVIAWCGGAPKWTLRGALIGVLDGEPRALAGYHVNGSRAVVVSEIRMSSDEARRHGRDWIRGARALLNSVKAAGLPAHATADEDWPNSGKFLERLGFTRADNGVYVLWEVA